MTSLTLVIPLYREALRLGDSFQKIIDFTASEKEVTVETIFVDDGSPDQTVRVVQDLIRTTGLPRARILSYPKNQGKGYAVRTGVLAAKGDYILMTDADLSTPLTEWRKLKAMLDTGVDFVCGSRAKEGAEIGIPPPWRRRLLSHFFRFVVRFCGIREIRDTQCGFKLFHAAPAKEVFSLLRIRRFAFDVELILLARDKGYKVSEVPVHWDYSGSSTVRVMSSGPRMLWDLFVLVLRRFFYLTV